MTPCPICERAPLSPSDDAIDLGEVLRRWEEALGIVFPETVRQAYSTEVVGPVTLFRCAACGFGRFDPPTPGSAEFYAAITAVDYYVREKWEFAEAIRDIQALGARRVLEVGCGAGYFLRLLRQSEPSLKLVGNDLNEELLAKLEADGFETLVGSPDELAIRHPAIEPFDVVCVFQTLEHVADPVAFLRALSSLVRPAGTLIVTTPDAAGPIRHFADALTELPPHHLTQWTESAFRAALPRVGAQADLIRHEPLPDYLWDSYLPVLWSEGCWLAPLFDKLAARRRYETPLQHAGLALEWLRSLGIKRLYGMPGHTLYVLAHRETPNV